MDKSVALREIVLLRKSMAGAERADAGAIVMLSIAN
jgi:hypothetical protein